MQGPTGFNPGFDRKKESLMQLSNKNGGLDPLDYLYSKSASFQSLIASDIKGGLAEFYNLYSTGIVSYDIQTHTIEADIATITTIYSNNIINKYTITTNDLYVYDNIHFGTSTKDSKTIIYGSVEAHSGPWDIGTSTMLLSSGATEFDLGVFSLDAGVTTMVTAASSWAAGALTLNTPELAINAIAGIAPLGYIQMYAGLSCLISAPTLNIGRDFSSTFGARTDIINISAALNINASAVGIEVISGVEGTTLRTTSQTQIISDLSCSISAGEGIDILLVGPQLIGDEKINIAGPLVTIIGDTSLQLVSDKNIDIYLDDPVAANEKMRITMFSETVDHPVSEILIDATNIKIGQGGIGYKSTDSITMQGNGLVWISSSERGSKSSFILGPAGSTMSGLKTYIGYLTPDSDIGETKNIIVESSEDINFSSRSIKIQNTNAIFGILQPDVKFYTNAFNVNSVGTGIEDRQISSTNFTSDHGITLQNNAPFSPLNIKCTVQDINITTGSVGLINIKADGQVKVIGLEAVQIRSDSIIALDSEEISASSLTIPTVRFVEGEGVIAPVVNTGDCTFELRNMVTCEAGVLKLTDITVNITFV